MVSTLIAKVHVIAKALSFCVPEAISREIASWPKEPRATTMMPVLTRDCFSPRQNDGSFAMTVVGFSQ